MQQESSLKLPNYIACCCNRVAARRLQPEKLRNRLAGCTCNRSSTTVQEDWCQYAQSLYWAHLGWLSPLLPQLRRCCLALAPCGVTMPAATACKTPSMMRPCFRSGHAQMGQAWTIFSWSLSWQITQVRHHDCWYNQRQHLHGSNGHLLQCCPEVVWLPVQHC